MEIQPGYMRLQPPGPTVVFRFLASNPGDRSCVQTKFKRNVGHSETPRTLGLALTSLAHEQLNTLPVLFIHLPTEVLI